MIGKHWSESFGKAVSYVWEHQEEVSRASNHIVIICHVVDFLHDKYKVLITCHVTSSGKGNREKWGKRQSIVCVRFFPYEQIPIMIFLPPSKKFASTSLSSMWRLGNKREKGKT